MYIVFILQKYKKSKTTANICRQTASACGNNIKFICANFRNR